MHRFIPIATLLLCLPAATVSAASISGTVVDANGNAVSAVRVRVTVFQNAPGISPTSGTEVVTTNADGSFSLDVQAPGGYAVAVSFGKKGYYNTARTVLAASNLPLGKITMSSLGPIDNDKYTWIKPFWPKMDTSDVGCNACHGEQADDWLLSDMAKSAQNERVFSLYKGTDVKGNPTGGGYRDDNPNKAGPCANCHAPAAAINAPDDTRLDQVEGVAREGVFCDVCHKIRDVKIGGGLGVGGAVQLQRQPAWLNFFAFGPFDDYLGGPMLTTFNPLLTQARFCGGCHEYVNDHGVTVQSTYSEWAEMSGADPDALQCQDCHMKKKFGKEYQGEPEGMAKILNDEHVAANHGTWRPKSKIFPHTFHGGREYAKEAADLEITTSQVEGELVVKARIDNVNAGHALPTGMPFRHMILVVDATVDGKNLAQTAGPTVPDYGGKGGAPEDLAGKPGKGFARVLGDDTDARNVPFWRATREIEDTRIRPAEFDEFELRFEVPEAGGAAKVSAQLVYRRTFRKMNVERKWGEKDLVINTAAADATLKAWDKPAVTPKPDANGGADVSADTGGEDSGCSAHAAGQQSPWLPLGLALLLLVWIRQRRLA